MYNSTELLESLRSQTEKFLQKAVTEWQMLPAEVLSTKPAPEKWSIAQCLEHLNIYGQYYLPAMEKAILEARRQGRWPASATFHPGWLGGYFTKLMRPQPDGRLSSKMKAPENARPSTDPDPQAMLAEFIDQHETLLKLLDVAASVSLHRIRIPISIAPWLRLKLGDTFLFLVAHTERHVLQAERALMNTAQPAARAAG